MSLASPSQTQRKSLRDHQVDALVSLLNLNAASKPSSAGTGPLRPSSASSTFTPRQTPSDANASAPFWKVLIMDSKARDVLATTLRVQDLRDNGITLHLCVDVSVSDMSEKSYYHRFVVT